MIVMHTLFALWSATASAQDIPVPERPRDPWFFRCVLDEKPRMLTIALSRDMWVAYDAQTCSFAKAWKGGVHFAGAVYDSVHGPQPTSFGETYLRGLPGNVWAADVGGKEVPVRVQWLGFQHTHGRVHMNYRMYLPDGRHMGVQETPEFISTETVLPVDAMLEFGLVEGMPGLFRSYAVDAIPDGVFLSLHVAIDGAIFVMPYPPDQLQRESMSEEVDANGVRVTKRSAYLPFGLHRVKANLALFFDPLPDANEPAPR